ncbi:MAG: hypothetical protein FWD59_03620 [Micrococcales bacterium]|nr:hypothetical protein [Micrococcales bacterium]
MTPNNGKTKTRKRSAIVGATVTILALAGGGAWAWVALDPNRANPSADPEATTSQNLTTAQVEQRDLTTSYMTSCPVDYGDQTQVVSGPQGTLTKLPTPETVVKPGDTLYRVDDSPVTLLKGSLPAWRDFIAYMSDGRDIAQLKKALTALGYATEEDIGTSKTWNAALSTAVRDFNEDRGLTRSSTLAKQSVFFHPGKFRVAAQLAGLGDSVQPGSPIFSYTGTDQRLTCSLESSNRRFAVVDREVRVEFPDGSAGTGTITETVTNVASNPGESDSITLSIHAPETKGQDSGTLARITFIDVLAQGAEVVPVTALVAFVDGGYGVQKVASDGSLTYVPVTTGQFADSWVQVTTSDLAVGDTVVVAP